MSDAPSPAGVVASVYEQASDGEGAAAEDKPPEGPPDTVTNESNEPAASPELLSSEPVPPLSSPVSTEPTTSPEIISSEPAPPLSSPVSTEPATSPEIISSEPAPPLSSPVSTEVPPFLPSPEISNGGPPPGSIAQGSITPIPLVSPPGTFPVPRMNLNGLRLRMKVWTDPGTRKRYLMPMAFMRDLMNGQPVTDVMYAYAMSDDGTKIVTLTAGEWNALPFFYFQEDGHAPRAATRPMDTVP